MQGREKNNALQCLSGQEILEEPEIKASKAKQVFQSLKDSLGNCLKL